MTYSLVKNCVACHPVLKKHLEMIEEKEIDSDTSDTSPKQKTVVKRKRRVAYKEELEAKTHTFLEKPQFNYVLDDDVKAQWNDVSSKLLSKLIEKIVFLANLSLTEAENVNFGYRHALFLKGKIKILESSYYFDCDSMKISSKMAFNLSMYVTNNTCLQSKTINSESGFVSKMRRSLLLEFDKKLVKESSDLSLLLNHLSCNQYMHLVVDIECVIYYFMLLNDLTYEEASCQLGIKRICSKNSKET